ncbi:transposase domain-containing protein [Rhizobium leguminosarum]|uniref:transposase domain-containing protein n=1 Tax=Rhizobium leguminosarum TaxID=384 RepID=UPI003D7AEB97
MGGKPKADAFRHWAEAQLTRIPGKSDLATAFRCVLSRWSSLYLFPRRRSRRDRQQCRRVGPLRPIGVERWNWLFPGADTGAETLARAMTIIETAKMNGLDPQAYLAVLDRIHDHKVNRLEFVCETVALHSPVLSIGPELASNEYFKRGKVRGYSPIRPRSTSSAALCTDQY